MSTRWRWLPAERRSTGRSMRRSRRLRAARSSSIWATGSCRRRQSSMSSRCLSGCEARRDQGVAMTADVKTRGLRAGIGLIITAVLLGALLWWHPSGLYLLAKAVHIIAVISWMAGMLYLPRLFIYHCEAEPGSRQSETFKVMERRLLTVIINPAMVVTWGLGLWLGHDRGWLNGRWLHWKFGL